MKLSLTLAPIINLGLLFLLIISRGADAKVALYTLGSCHWRLLVERELLAVICDHNDNLLGQILSTLALK